MKKLFNDYLYVILGSFILAFGINFFLRLCRRVRLVTAMIAIRTIATITTITAGSLLLPELVRILDLLVGRIDLLHSPGCFLISGVQVRMVFLCQPPVGFFDLLIGGIRADSQNLIGIFMHDRSLFPF